MHVIIGCDEAGYGPNLGPLVISATAWQLPDGADADFDLYAALADCICSKAEKPRPDRPRRMPIADSKQLYQSGGDYRALEEAVLTGLNSLERAATSWHEVWQSLAPGSVNESAAEPWHADYDRELPIDSQSDEIGALSRRFAESQTASGVTLLNMRSVCLFPTRFNQLCDQFGSKGMVLSTATLKLVAELVRETAAEQVTVLADKHGGRNRYGQLIQEAFDDQWVQVRRESREESCYRLRDGSRTIDFFFRVGGEESLPTAWASLCCKYLRELSMDAFNAFWNARVPGLHPTAGYPVDAKRFMSDIESSLAAEQIDLDVIWRKR